MTLSAYDMVIVHRKGSENEAADALSRLYTEINADKCVITPSDEEIFEVDWYEEHRRAVREYPDRFQSWAGRDDFFFVYRPDPAKEAIGDDHNAWKLVVPSEERYKIFQEFHDHPQAGHPEIEKAYRRAAVFYSWPGINDDIRQYPRKCDTCNRYEPDQTAPFGFMETRAIE